MVSTYGVPLAAYLAGNYPVWILLPIMSLPLAVHNTKMIYTLSGRALNDGLGRTAMLALAFSLLLAIGLVAA
jgi:1,4-dihydroxy-2-naphthoate octaprenyltransferase